MLFDAGRSIKGKSDISPSFSEIILRMTSARLALKISGGSKQRTVLKLLFGKKPYAYPVLNPAASSFSLIRTAF